MNQPHSGIQRQHELDALRAFAMLLGIGLHAALAFNPGFAWVVTDPKPDPIFPLITAGIHGFRMPLFILISGYFTMLLWRRRGLGPLLKQRFLRVFLPCILGLVTILPLSGWAGGYAREIMNRQDAAKRGETPLTPEQEAQKQAEKNKKSELVEMIRKGDHYEIELLLADGADPNQADPEFGIPALGWSALYGDPFAARLLIDFGAELNIKDRDSYRPLHSASFLGHVELVELLLKNGADPNVRGRQNDTPLDSSRADQGTTQSIAKALRVPLNPKEVLEEGREKCRKILIAQMDPSSLPVTPSLDSNSFLGRLESLRKSYRDFLTWDGFNIRFVSGWDPVNLTLGGTFGHLWFLWFLCYFVLAFAFFALISQWIPFPRIAPVWILSPLRWLWLLPLTMLPQLFMGVFRPGFGPDTSTAILPQPHLLFYYAIFFFVGALYYDCDDRDGKLSRWWWLELPIGLLVLYPLGNLTLGQLITSGFIQVIYTWTMIFGLIGLFRAIIKKESPTLRYISDSAYWLYLAHIPLLFVLQAWMRPWEINSLVKFTITCVVATAFLLLTYQLLVRYTWIGWLLNGPRKRPHAQPLIKPMSPTE